MRIVLLGPPGSGKGTQGDLISRHYGFPRVSTGDILRRAVRERTDLGLQAEAIMKKGELVSDDIVLELVRRRTEAGDCRRGYILDGFPRNLAQAEALETIDPGRPGLALELMVDSDLLVRRLGARLVCPGCQALYNLDVQPPRTAGLCDACGQTLVQREDDSAAVITERLKVYRREAEPLRAFYVARNSYAAIPAVGTVPEIFERIVALIDQALAAAGTAKENGRR